nr:MAG TPA: nucelotide kinase [Caudoviricetes sp.]
MTKTFKPEIIISLVDQNKGSEDSGYCQHGANDCNGIMCGECPLIDNNVTIGDVRRMDPRVKPEAPDDGVRKPSHYQVFDGVESIEIIARSMTVSEFRGFCLGNVLKYRLRAGKKSELATMEKDLNKAAFYQELFDLHKGKCHDSK